MLDGSPSPQPRNTNNNNKFLKTVYIELGNKVSKTPYQSARENANGVNQVLIQKPKMNQLQTGYITQKKDTGPTFTGGKNSTAQVPISKLQTSSFSMTRASVKSPVV